MEILFLTISDQQNHPLHKYVDLHCNFDFAVWEKGFRAVSSSVHIFDFYASFVSNGPISMENSIRDLVRKHNIKLLVVPNLYYELSPTFINELRAIGCNSMIVFFDDSMRFENTNRFYLNSFDFYLTHESVDSKLLYKPYGIEPEFFPNLPSRTFYDGIIKDLDKSTLKCVKDVVFVGARIADRDIFVNYLKDNGIDIEAFGRGWVAGMLSTDEMIAAFNLSKISLSFVKTVDGSGRFQLKGRLFEIVMSGGFVLSEFCEELTDYFDIGSEIDTFKTPQELLDKVRFYLENRDLRDEMSARAKDKAEKKYSFESSWLRYLTDIKNGRIKSEYPNPGYEVPASTIKEFMSWNFSFIYGQSMLGQYGLAYQQYKFCRRELEALVCNNSIIKEFVKWIVRRFIMMVVNLVFTRNHIHKIRPSRSSC